VNRDEELNCSTSSFQEKTGNVGLGRQALLIRTKRNKTKRCTVGIYIDGERGVRYTAVSEG
jgi:hypothetical protein